MIGQLILGAALIVLLAAAWSDIRSFRIPNAYPLALILLFVPFAFFGDGVDAPLWHLAHFAAALAVGMLLFGLKWIGGGDAKLYAAIALWFPLAQAPLLLLSITLAGGVVALVYILMRRFGIGPNAKLDRKDRRIPYGVALAVGAMACWFLQPVDRPKIIDVNELSGKPLPKL